MTIKPDGVRTVEFCETCGSIMPASGGNGGGPIEPVETASAPDDLPAFVIKRPEAVILTKEVAQEIGLALYKLIYKKGCPRRKVVNRLHHEVDVRIDEGLLLREADFSLIDFTEDYLDEAFTDDPSYRWLSAFAKRCDERGVRQAPEADLYERFARLDLAMRALGLI